MMKIIQTVRNLFALCFAVCLLITGWFALANMSYAASIFGAGSVIWIILLIFQEHLLFKVRLIWDNRILTIPSAVIIREEDGKEKVTGETVVSTFGALVGGKVYKWGCDGLTGSRLQSIAMDRERISLTFGSRAKTLRLELLHGMDNVQKVAQVKENLLHETGVEAAVVGW